MKDFIIGFSIIIGFMVVMVASAVYASSKQFYQYEDQHMICVHTKEAGFSAPTKKQCFLVEPI